MKNKKNAAQIITDTHGSIDLKIVKKEGFYPLLNIIGANNNVIKPIAIVANGM